MKKLQVLTSTTALLLMFSACSSGPETQPQTLPGSTASAGSPTRAGSPTTPGQTSKATPGASAAANTATPGAGNTAAAKPTQGAASPSPAPDPSATPLSGLGLNAHGNLSQKVGETSVFGAATGQQFADLTAVDITANFKCPGPNARESINGQFVAIRIKVSVHKNFPDSGWPNLDVSNMDFKAWDAAGKEVVDPIGNSGTCLPAKDLVASPVEPGSSAGGLVVLDVPKGAGSAAFVVGGFEGSYGWEWHW